MWKRFLEKGTAPFSIAVSAAILAAVVLALLLPGVPGWVLPALALVAAAGGLLLLLAGLRFRKAYHREREHTLYCDRHSGLPNADRLEQDFAGAKDAEKVFVLIRLRAFHRLTTLFGLQVGGETIQRLCKPLREFAASHGGQAYRISLDQFGLVTQASGQEQFLVDLCGLLREMEQVNVVNHNIAYSYHYIFVYGVYFLKKEEGASFRQVIESTEFAIERLPDGNETRGTVFTEQTKPDWLLRGELAPLVRGAWEKKEFVPYYQMVYNLKNGHPVGAELLTRWQHPTRGLLPPSEFLPLMEEQGLIMDLDLYMLEEACKKIQGWIKAELITVPLSINLSKLNIHREGFIQKLVSLVRSYDIPPVLVELEMTESIVLFEKNEEFLSTMAQLHSFGFTLSMDNFAATDFSSINLLRDLPVDIIKVSNKFFERVRESERDRIFVSNVLRMAKELKIKIVAQGVETAEQADFYKSIGCDCAQGYYFSRPISNEEFQKQIF